MPLVLPRDDRGFVSRELYCSLFLRGQRRLPEQTVLLDPPRLTPDAELGPEVSKGSGANRLLSAFQLYAVVACLLETASDSKALSSRAESGKECAD